ncbi:MAG: endonuclease/exonuclease/phosphatase family protein [Candidatus Marinimicrobia bacterium]|nr:endonuclease/exonuclease/phosphatase family protein [Candidatus Neomarinimicrobiota bacterium]
MKNYFLLLSLFLLSFCENKNTLTVMSYNVRHGVSMNWEPALENQASILKNQAPDWVALQEIDNICRRSGLVDQTNRFSEWLQMDGTFGKFMDFDSGQYGMAVLSGMKVLDSEVMSLPEGAEPRVAIIQTIEYLPGIHLALANVHLDWTQPEFRLSQARSLVRRLDEIALPAIILGDFNAGPGSPTLDLFQKAGFIFIEKGDNHLTWEAANPTEELDHVCFRPAGKVAIFPLDCEVLNEPEASDHRPIVAKFHLKVPHE